MATKFHFRLATLLRIREATRDERRVALAETQRADAELQNRLEHLAGEQNNLAKEQRKMIEPGAIDMANLIKVDLYAETLRSEETELRERRKTLAIEIERRRQTLIEADREVQTLEKLRENQLQTHRQDAQHQEHKQLDEAAMRRVGMPS